MKTDMSSRRLGRKLQHPRQYCSLQTVRQASERARARKLTGTD